MRRHLTAHHLAWLAERDGLAVETAVEGLADRLAQLPEGDHGS